MNEGGVAHFLEARPWCFWRGVRGNLPKAIEVFKQAKEFGE